MKGKSYSQRSCCNSENPFQSETTTCSAPLPPESLREPAPAPTVSYEEKMSRSELIELVGIIVGAVAAAAAVLTVFMMRQSNPASSPNPAITQSNGAASSTTTIDPTSSSNPTVTPSNGTASLARSISTSEPSSVNNGGFVNNPNLHRWLRR